MVSLRIVAPVLEGVAFVLHLIGVLLFWMQHKGHLSAKRGGGDFFKLLLVGDLLIMGYWGSFFMEKPLLHLSFWCSLFACFWVFAVQAMAKKRDTQEGLKRVGWKFLVLLWSLFYFLLGYLSPLPLMLVLIFLSSFWVWKNALKYDPLPLRYATMMLIFSFLSTLLEGMFLGPFLAFLTFFHQRRFFNYYLLKRSFSQ